MKMIRCENCGAEFDSSAPVCPYCGAENFKVSLNEQDDFLKDVSEKTKELYNIPEKKAQKATKRTNIVFIAVLVCIAVVIAGAFIISNLVNQQRIRKQEELIGQLEEAYLSDDYDRMDKILDENNIYQHSFDKYIDLSNAYTWYKLARDGFDLLDRSFVTNLGKEEVYDFISSDIDFLLDALSELEPMKEKGFIRDEERGYKYITGLIYEITDRYSVPRELMESKLKIYEGRGSVDHTDMIDIIIEAVMK